MIERTLRNAGWSQTNFIKEISQPVNRFVDDVIVRGQVVHSRYGSCYEILGGRFECESGILIARTGINHALGWMEFLQLVAGVYDLEGLKRVAPSANHELFTYAMAYGPRVAHQMLDVIHALQRDPNTRQAVLFVGNLEDGCTMNLPCTLTIQFLLREDRLNAVVSMRSWDLCRGLPYDLMMFSGLLEVVARCLGKIAWKVVVQSGSTHVYLDQMDRVPYESNKRWRFKQNSPIGWTEFHEWAHQEIPKLTKGGIPNGIEVVAKDG